MEVILRRSRSGSFAPHFVLVAVLTLIAVFNVSPQENSTSIKEIAAQQQQQQRIEKLYSEIKESEKTTVQRRKTVADAPALAALLEARARLQKELLILLRKQERNFELAAGKRNKFREAAEDLAVAYETALREALDAHSQFNNQQSLAVASLKIELALTLPNDRFLKNISSLEEIPEKIKELFAEQEKLYAQALETQERLAGADSDLTLNTVSLLSDFYLNRAEFEKALELFERHRDAGEKKYGANHRNLVAALRGIGMILAKTDREAEAAIIAARVSSITGRPEKYYPSNSNLINRAENLNKVTYGDFRTADPLYFGGFTALAFAETRLTSKLLTDAAIKRIVVTVQIDENGDVIETKLFGKTKKAKEIEAAARKTKFRPFIYRGVARKMRGNIVYDFIE